VQLEQPAKSILIPRFTLRWLLGLIVVAAGISLILAQTRNNQAWALAIVIAMQSVLLVFGIYAWFFAMAWFVALLRRNIARPPVASSPFASAGPPAQLVPPRQPE
jgi:hypothetical protein